MSVSTYSTSRIASIINNSGSYLTNAYARSGLYTKDQINTAKYKQYSRFGRVLDGQGRLNNTTEYLFFTKPDLHLVDFGRDGSSVINSELTKYPYFVDLVNHYPEVVKQLQYSADPYDPFAHLLSFCVNNNLDLPSIDATTLDNPQTMFGTSYEYMGNAEASDENPTFSLEFVDSKDLELYHFFKGYQEYHIARKDGTITPPNRNTYTFKRRLHNVMGIYKFLVSEDFETIIHYSYVWGAFPVSCPREAFSDPLFPDGLTYSVNFKAAFVKDMDPSILTSFNQLMLPMIRNKSKIPVVQLMKFGDSSSAHYNGVDGTLPSAAYITRENRGTGKIKYYMNWF